MKSRKYRYFVGDFETTVYKGQVNTEVWASACVELYQNDVKIFHSIAEQFEYFKSLNCNLVVYYHNLKFDGEFWLSYLLIDLGYEQAGIQDGETIDDFHWIPPNDMPPHSVAYSISNMGQWYRILIKIGRNIIELRDSYKLLPFTVKRIGDSFQTEHRKLEMEYTGLRYAGCAITDEERQYITNDILVIKEALEITFNQGHKKLTIGSCCLAEYKALIGKNAYESMFPNMYEYKIDPELYKYENAGEYIKQSYRGGWCYLARGKENKIYHNGTTADVNSLYPSMMSSESLNCYPIGYPTFWKGNYIPDEALADDKYYFIRFKTRFYLKKGMLPFIQIKNTLRYQPNLMLETSDVYSTRTGKYHSKLVDFEGEIIPSDVIITMTMTDYKLMLEHYNLVDFEILDGCYFDSAIGIFDRYINKYKKIKLESKGAVRELAKLFLNNLYGKMASNTTSSFKVAYIKENKTLAYYTVQAHDKIPGYIPVGSAITSYARNFTIRAAQKNYHGKDKHGFIYADTDSIHCDLEPQEMQGITVHSKDFCCWKIEGQWDEAIFTRQKTYIEHVIIEDGEHLEEPYYNVKCAGMPDKCKNLFLRSMDTTPLTKEELELYTEEEQEFLKTKRTLTDFKVGLVIPGKLIPKRIRGGVLLTETTYEMR